MDINKTQKINLDFLNDNTASVSRMQVVDMKGVDAILSEYAEKFKSNLVASIKKYQITASGDMQSPDNLYFDLIEEPDGGRTLNIYVVEYAKFVDKGVKGWGSSKNAPASPYSYRNPAKTSSNGEFRKRIKRYIEEGKGKVIVSDVRKYGAVGGEEKKLSLIDLKVNKLMYLIRRFGIKTTNFLQQPLEQSFVGLEKKIADEYAVNISVKLFR
jgi:hypothetical protein